jgi:predicted DNA-binding protein (MmcQ/YjbR family)
VNEKIFVFPGSADSPTWPAITGKLQDSNAEALGVPGAEATGYGLGKRGWGDRPARHAEGAPLRELTDWVEESYRLVAPKRLVAELDFADR